MNYAQGRHKEQETVRYYVGRYNREQASNYLEAVSKGVFYYADFATDEERQIYLLGLFDGMDDVGTADDCVVVVWTRKIYSTIVDLPMVERGRSA